MRSTVCTPLAGLTVNGVVVGPFEWQHHSYEMSSLMWLHLLLCRRPIQMYSLCQAFGLALVEI